MGSKQVRFADLLTSHVSNKIREKFLNQPLTDALMREIRDTIRLTIQDVFERSTHKLTIEAINWVANQIFKSIQINGDQSIADMVVINEYKLEELPYPDIQLMRNLFNETALSGLLEEEYRRRSMS